MEPSTRDNRKHRRGGRLDQLEGPGALNLGVLHEALSVTTTEGVEAVEMTTLDELPYDDPKHSPDPGAESHPRAYIKVDVPMPENEHDDSDLDSEDEVVGTSADSVTRAVHAVQRDINSDNELTKNVIDLARGTWGREFENLDSEKLAQFEAGVRSRIGVYKKAVVNTQQATPKSRIQGDILLLPTHASPVTTLAPKAVVKKPVNRLLLFQRADTFNFKFPTKDKQILYQELEYRPASSGVFTPRTKLSKQISDTVCSMVAEIYNFADNGKTFIKYDGKTKPEARNDTKEKELMHNFAVLHKSVCNFLGAMSST